MMQQINLYQPIFREQKKVFSAAAMLQVTGLIVLILLAIYGYNLWQLQPFEQQIAQVNADHQRLSQQIEEMRQKVKANKKSQLLEDELKRVQQELERKRKVMTVISEGRFGNQSGFSDLWAGLARQHVDGLWLTRIQIDNGGKQLLLSGKTVSAELVPVYIQKLSNESAFSGLSFNVLELNRDEDNPSVILFNLGTSQDRQKNG